jgi:putative oxidoreductase
MVSLGLLLLRLTVGSLLAGHGAQKLFGSFGGPGIEGTSGWLHAMGFRPGRPWAVAAGGAEFGGGLLTALGFLSPLGPIGAISSMLTATTKAHAGKPVWVTQGGAELPLTNMAALTAIMLAGPGAVSLDRLFGVRLPRWFSLLASGGAAAFTWISIQRSNEVQQQEQAPAEERISEPVFAVPASEAEMPEVTEGS